MITRSFDKFKRSYFPAAMITDLFMIMIFICLCLQLPQSRLDIGVVAAVVDQSRMLEVYYQPIMA